MIGSAAFPLVYKSRIVIPKPLSGLSGLECMLHGLLRLFQQNGLPGGGGAGLLIGFSTFIFWLGLCVDYSAHIAHAFLHAKGTRDAKVTP
jgi:hypothetical protein